MYNSDNRRGELTAVVAVTTSLLYLVARSASAQGVWEKQFETSLPYSAVDFIDDQVGYVGGYGVIMKTTDGGQTWTNIFPEYLFASDQYEIAAVSADEVWTLGSPSSSLRWTRDGGQTFPWPTRVLAKDYGEFTWATRMGVTGDGTFILVGQVEQTPLILLTRDGTEFTRIDPELIESNLLYDVATVGESTAWAVGTYHGLFKTEDSGQTWEKLDYPANEEDGFVQHVFFLEDGVYGWISSQHNLWRTTDGGENWEKIANVVALGAAFNAWEPVRQLFFVSAQQGWMVTERVLYYTVDGGANWAQFELDGTTADTKLGGISCPSPDLCWLVTGTGNGGSPSATGVIGLITHVFVANENETPSDATSLDVFPNPVNASAQIQFTLDAPEQISVRVYDLLGRNLETLTSTMGHEGVNRLAWRRDGLSAGFYLLRLTAGSRSYTTKIMVVN